MLTSNASCIFDEGGDTIVDGTGDGSVSSDGAVIDGSITGDAGPCTDWETHRTFFDPCELPAPNNSLTLGQPGTYRLDTNTGILMDPAGSPVDYAGAPHAYNSNPELWTVSVASFGLGSGSILRVEGNRPLLIAARATVVIDGVLDVSSYYDEQARISVFGAGSTSADCEFGAGERGMQHDDGAGGGGGGAFRSYGGVGGQGKNDTAGLGGTSGIALTGPPDRVRAGCGGGKGGIGQELDGSGIGGAGGGAVYVAARESIIIGGDINANGAGGGEADGDLMVSDSRERCGGGGGGSGGLISLESPSIIVNDSGRLAANGGGGGEGSDKNRANPGQDGQMSTIPATGGADAEGGGGDGGDGGSLDNDLNGADGQTAGRGGGGGGGGVGFILFYGTTPTLNGTPELSPGHHICAPTCLAE